MSGEGAENSSEASPLLGGAPAKEGSPAKQGWAKFKKGTVTSKDWKFKTPPAPPVEKKDEPVQEEDSEDDSSFTDLKNTKWTSRGLWQHPRLCVEEGVLDLHMEVERSMTWSELFYDLIFVTSTGKMGEEYRSGNFTIGVYLLYFVTIFMVWYAATSFGTRFHGDDLSSKLYFTLQMAGMLGITMNIPGSYGDAYQVDHWTTVETNLSAFAYSLAIVHLLETIMHLRIAYWFHFNPTLYARKNKVNRTRNYAVNEVVITTLQMIGWLLLGTEVITAEYALWVFAMDIFWRWGIKVIMFIIAIIAQVVDPNHAPNDEVFNFMTLPYHMEHFTERMGLIIIIMLGETIDGIAVHIRTGGTLVMYATVFVAFFIIVCFKLLYFDCSICDLECHALVASHLRSLIWFIIHPFLAASVAMTGDALALFAEEEVKRGTSTFELLISEEPESAHAPSARQTLCYAMGAAHVLLCIAGNVHVNKNTKGADSENPDVAARARFFQWLMITQIITELSSAGVAFGLVWVDPSDLSELAVLAILLSCCVILVVLNLVDEVVEHSWHDPLTESRDAEEVAGHVKAHLAEEHQFSAAHLTHLEGMVNVHTAQMDLDVLITELQQQRAEHGPRIDAQEFEAVLDKVVDRLLVNPEAGTPTHVDSPRTMSRDAGPGQMSPPSNLQDNQGQTQS